ncbi:MAG: hypothetical protein EOO56_16325 [Hymenobacter sp.]|nr:MAG: hypothetical protein EOO56_16325 [Hymenobacter sp.]
MNPTEIFDGLSLPHNQNIELKTLLSAPLAGIWAEFPEFTPWTRDETGPLLSLYPRSARLEQVQIMGLNPSYTAGDRGKTDYPVEFTSHPYFRRIGKFGQQVSDRHQQLFQEPAYLSSQQLYHFGELDWGHLDLLYMRTTSQSALEKQVWNTPGAASFVWKQLQLTKRLLAALQPVAIVIANRFGQRLTGFHKDSQTNENEWMGLQFTTRPDELGAYRITGSTTNRQPDPDYAFGLAGTPVYFTSSFAGTHPRSAEADKLLINQLAETCLREGDRYFEKYHLK